MPIFNRVKEIVRTIVFAASPRLYGRSSSGAGNGEEISIGSGLTLTSGVLSVSVAWSEITGKPATFTPSAHTHTSANISDASTTGEPNMLVRIGEFGEITGQSLVSSSSVSVGDAQNTDGKVIILSGDGYPFSWARGDDSEFFAILPPVTIGQYFYTLPSRSGTVALIPAGPYANDQLAAGSAYLGNPLYGLLIFSPSAGTTHHNKQVAIVAPAVLTSPLSVTVTPTLLTVSLEVSGYNPISTIAEVAAAINATAIPNNYFRAVVVSFGTSQASTMATTNLTNGSDTPHVSVGSLYYTADGSVKRRMA